LQQLPAAACESVLLKQPVEEGRRRKVRWLRVKCEIEIAEE
jgi:hypothetical protein